MLKRKNPVLFLAIAFILAILGLGIFTSHVTGQVQPIDKVEGKLQEISEVEKAVLEDLFTLSQEIDEMEKKEAVTNYQLETLRSEMDQLTIALEENQKTHDLQLWVLKQLLLGYQKKGPATYLETFLSAGDLTTFLKSLNILKDVGKNSQELMESINEGKKQLEKEKTELAEKEEEVLLAMDELQNAISKMQKLRKEQEKILVSLADQRQTFEAELHYIENMWEEIKGLFSNIIVYFNNIIKKGNLPLDQLDLKVEFPRIKGRLTDQVINDVLKGQSDLPEMYFRFHPDVIDVEIPQKQLFLQCHFVIENKSSITFIIDSGTFYGMPLTQGSINELLQNGTLKLDFKELLGIITVESAETFEGYMNFVIAPLLP